MLWIASPGLHDIHELHVVLAQSGLMGWADTSHSYLAMTKESEYSEEKRLEIAPSRAKYLFVYPFWKKREWYRLPAEERMRIMREHIEMGRRYPSVSINTTYSFGIDDQEFVVAFEADEPGDFLDLVQELRGKRVERIHAQGHARSSPASRAACAARSMRSTAGASGGATGVRVPPTV